MGLHLHRLLTILIIAVFMLMPGQAPAAFSADNDVESAQEVQQSAEPQKDNAKAEEETTESSDRQANPEVTPSQDQVQGQDVSGPDSSGGAPKADGSGMAKESVSDQASESPSGETAGEAAETAESSAKSEKNDEMISISFCLLADEEHGGEWVKQIRISVAKDSTVKDVLEGVLKELNGKCKVNEDGSIEKITFKFETGSVTLTSGSVSDEATEKTPSEAAPAVSTEDKPEAAEPGDQVDPEGSEATDDPALTETAASDNTSESDDSSAASENKKEAAKWMYRVNGKDHEKGADKYVLKDNDKLIVFYKTEEADKAVRLVESAAPAEATGETAEAEGIDDSLDVLKGSSASAGKSVDNAYGNTKDVVAGIAANANWSEDSIWLVFGLARAGALTSEQGEAYYNNVLAKLESTGSPVINANQSSHNSRAILALTAAGYNATDIGGYNLLGPLANMSYIRAQGVNGPIWALLAFDSKGYEIPQLTGVSEAAAAKLQTSREKLVQSILGSRKSDGGWAYSGSKSDVDMTAMAIQSLAPYYNTNPEVKTAVDEALTWLSSAQNSDGSFSSGGYVCSESSSQVIVALTSLGIDPAKDKRFLKNGKGALDSLMSFYTKGGGFKHVEENYKYNVLATYEGYYALVAYYRNLNGRNTLYDMTDAGEDFVIDVDYSKEKPDSNNENGENKSNNDNNNSNNKGTANKQKQQGKNTEQQKKEEAKPLGATKGLTKSAGLIKLKGGNTAEAKNSMSLIEAVVKRGLSEDATTYTEDDIKAINEAYSAYLKLQPAEKLAVEKDKNWKPFCKITSALGKIYHIDKDRGVDVLDNDDITMPWYVKLVVKDKEITEEQSNKIISILGENGQIFSTYDISFVDTLAESEAAKQAANDSEQSADQNSESVWHPSKLLKTNMGVPDALENNPVVIHITDKGKIEFKDNKVIEDKEKRYKQFGKYSQFQSDDFSVYGIAGTSGSIKSMMSQTEEEEPEADYLIWVYIGAAALAALALLLILRRRSKALDETGE